MSEESKVNKDGQVCSSKEVVDLCLQGHYAVNELINSSIRRIYRKYGAEGRKRMNLLAGLAEYPTANQVREFGEQFEKLLNELDAANVQRDADPMQMRLDWDNP